MKKSLSLLAFCLLLPNLAQAQISVEVYGKCGTKMSGARGTTDEAGTVFEATYKVLKEQKAIDLQTDESNRFVTTIGGLGDAREVTKHGVRAWGWDVSLNGQSLSDSAMVVEIPAGEKAKVKWTYGYVLMDKNDEKTCAGNDCSFHKATLFHCLAKNDTPLASYSYDLTQNGCSTGAHTFNSIAEYCSALKNDALNEGCAKDLRASLFAEKDCPGDF
jgi:hypothetical protein